jgi:SAM-dependent methyltransferase
MTLDRHDLAQIAARTLANYGARAADFRRGTRDHDVSQNIDELLRHIEASPPFRILDLGCGPGRDLQAFKALGHAPVGLEGLPEFAAMARAASGCEVLEQDFLRLELPPAGSSGAARRTRHPRRAPSRSPSRGTRRSGRGSSPLRSCRAGWSRTAPRAA